MVSILWRLLRGVITVLFFVIFLLSLLPLVGRTVGWIMLPVSIVFFLLLFFSPLSKTLKKMFYVQTWFRYSLYAVLVGLLMFTGCNIESKKYVKEFKEKIYQEKDALKILLENTHEKENL